MKQYIYSIHGLDCANCAANLSRKIRKIEGLSEVDINFMTEKLSFACEEDQLERMLNRIKAVIEANEPDAHLEGDAPASEHHHHHHHHDESDSDEHEHEHHHHEHDEGTRCVKMTIKGLHCPNCAANLAKEIGELEGIQSADINFDKERLHFHCEADRVEELTEKIKKIVADFDENVTLSPLGAEEHHHHDHEHHHHNGEECGCDSEDGSCSCGHEHHHHDHEHDHEHEHEHYHHEHDENTRCVKMTIKGLHCPNCAANLAKEIGELEGIQSADINFDKERLHFHCEADRVEELTEKIKKIVADFDE
ncbi:MAG: cation transporter, partial [Oscillospiraceae bacterium]|nr:cation transporter [Oscillospiraceae bacterium]